MQFSLVDTVKNLPWHGGNLPERTSVARSSWLFLTLLPLLLLMSPVLAQDNDFTYISNGQLTITAYTGRGGTITAPAMINGRPVTGIGVGAFAGSISLTRVTIPNGVKTIGTSAFHSCTSLTDVVIPNSVSSIGAGAFEDCSSLTSVSIPNGITTIGQEAFRGCTLLSSIVVASSVASIQDSAFSGDVGLT